MNSTEGEQKIQLIIAIVFKHTTDQTKNYTFYVRSKNIVMLQADDANDIHNKLLDSFFENYENEQNILRNGSNYVFDYVDISIMKFHTIELKKVVHIYHHQSGYQTKKQQSILKILRITCALHMQ